ncbi:MAG: hypothetical protein H6815_11625 [Phycisphaeraceae bacterium]|nr:hypothetical protein [Phycisphaerales bacterium]MCB9861088.1 hypothetical protein [Phycisphaeraceae bacterium]
MSMRAKREVGSRSRSRRLAALIVCSGLPVVACASHASGLGTYPDGLKETIESLSPDFYWPLENSFRSEVPSGSSSIVFTAYEDDGANEKWANPETGFMEVDYLPMMPDHSTWVEGSTALIFGESANDLAGAERYVELLYGDFGDEPLDALGMSQKDEWTLHMIVSPDPDPAEGTPSRTILYLGNDAADTSEVRNITIEVDVSSYDTTFTVVRNGQSYQNGPQVTLTHSSETDRYWFQVFLKYRTELDAYGQPQDPAIGIEQLELAVYSDTTSGRSIANSNQWIIANTPSVFRLGANHENGDPGYPFNGAIHHLAIWNSFLDQDSDEATLNAAIDDAPPARSVYVQDWDDDPTYIMWTVPTEVTTLTGGDRNLKNWTDPIWDRAGVYPMVRFFANDPYNSGSNYTAPYPYGSAVGTSVVPPVAIATSAKGWVDYIDDMLITYCSGDGAKSLSDGYSLFFQNWGREAQGAGDEYVDQPSLTSGGTATVSALIRNWRDVPTAWRYAADTTSVGLAANVSHPSTPSGHSGLDYDRHELDIAFYREGMSHNAFRTREIFRELKSQLSAASLPVPTRLHFDTEGMSRVDRAVYPDGASWSQHWWTTAANDSRFDNASYWAATTDTLDDILLGTNFDAYKAPWDASGDNYPFTNAYRSFARRQYEYALNQSLLVPAMQELNENILVSEYNLMATNQVDASDETEVMYEGKPWIRLESTPINYLDFSAPELYPLRTSSIQTMTEFHDWWDTIDLAYAKQTGSSATQIEDEDLDDLFVERSKHNVQASYLAGGGFEGTAIAPWICYPRTPWDVNGLLPYDAPYLAEWPEIARIAVFAYRRGTREFIFWGYNEQAEDDTSVAELELIMNAIEDAAETNGFLDVTTSGHTNRFTDALFGVPDGVIDCDDRTYFMARYAELDPEADIWDSVSTNLIPDGNVTSGDLGAYLNAFNAIIACDP